MNRVFFRLSWTGWAVLFLTLAANGLIAVTLPLLSGGDEAGPPEIRPRTANPIEVVLVQPDARTDPVREIPRRPLLEKQPPLRLPPPRRRPPPSKASPPPPLSLALTLDLPDLPRLLVDPATSMEGMDLDTLTAPVVAGCAVPEQEADTGRGKVAPVDSPPREVFLPRPGFPGAAARRHVRTGTVVAHFLVSRTGRVEAVKIIRADPEGFFERSVEQALGNARFSPARRRGRPVDRWCSKTFTFRLEDR